MIHPIRSIPLEDGYRFHGVYPDGSNMTATVRRYIDHAPGGIVTYELVPDVPRDDGAPFVGWWV